MLIVLAALSSHAGGGGLLLETHPGSSWTDASGPLVRGSTGGLSAAVFWGPYEATIQYGRYRRLGVNFSVTSATPFFNGPESAVLHSGIEFGTGIDLLKAGAYWKVQISPAFYFDAQEPGTALTVDSTEGFDLDYGFSVEATGAAVWWFGRNFGLVGQVKAGRFAALNRRDFFALTVGVGIQLRTGIVFKRKEDGPDKPDLKTIPMEDAAPEHL